MRLHEVLVARTSTIVAEWKDVMAQRTSEAPLAAAELCDNLPELIARVSEWLRSKSPDSEAQLRAVSRRHAEACLAEGISLDDLMQQLATLRRAVLRQVLDREILQDQAGRGIETLRDELVLINVAFDSVLYEAVKCHVHLRKRSLAVVEERLRLALESAAIGTWNLEVRSGTFSGDERCAAIYGLPGEFRISFGEFLAMVHPDDRQRVNDLALAALKQHDRGAYQAEYRILRASDHATRWIAARGSAVSGDSGRAVRFVGTVMDVSDAKAAEEARETFLGMLGHDLRSPLATISMSARQLARSGQVTTKAEGALARIARASERMTRMTLDLVDLARGRLGGLVVAPAWGDVAGICHSVMDDLRAAHPGRRIVLTTRGEVSGMFDRDRLAQALTNLVNNAVTYGSDPVVVTASASADRITIAVANAGPGIPEEERQALFEPFRRGRGRRAHRRGQGLGLGLYIVAQIMKAHGGSVEVHSDELRTVFTMTWPREPRGHGAPPGA